MSSRASTILIAVADLIDNAVGLTGTGRVIIGHPPQGKPATVPSAYVWHDGLSSTQEGEPLGNYRRELTLRALVFAQAGARTPRGATVAALDLLDLVTSAIEADRTIASNALDVVVTGISTTGDDFGSGKNTVGAEFQIVVYWSATSGEGV